MKGRFLNLPFAKEGVRFALPLILATGVSWLFGWMCIGAILFILTVFVVNFFRDPEREIPQVKGGIVSPADGKVVEIKRETSDPLYPDRAIRVSIFLDIFNVHINRIPIAGKIAKITYNKGKFLNAANEKASMDNEQNALLIETVTGKKVLVKQIAGLIARRIVCWSREGDSVMSGERFGLIRFGSRTDIFLPEGSDISVRVGDKVKGGRDLIGRIQT